MKHIKRLMALVLVIALVLTSTVLPAAAKTASSEKAENVFFYVENSQGKSVLLKVMSIDELNKISHGQANGDNYYDSSVDNYPTTQYGEARGFTITELIGYVKSETSVLQCFWKTTVHRTNLFRH